ncbi:hypothetical protein [Escherichia phage Es2]|nr:hypothetical protein [Escherichia phage Es2]
MARFYPYPRPMIAPSGKFYLQDAQNLDIIFILN